MESQERSPCGTISDSGYGIAVSRTIIAGSYWPNSGASCGSESRFAPASRGVYPCGIRVKRQFDAPHGADAIGKRCARANVSARGNTALTDASDECRNVFSSAVSIHP